MEAPNRTKDIVLIGHSRYYDAEMHVLKVDGNGYLWEIVEFHRGYREYASYKAFLNETRAKEYWKQITTVPETTWFPAY